VASPGLPCGRVRFCWMAQWTVAYVEQISDRSILPSSQKTRGTEFLNVDLCNWQPSPGEPVLGMGYPNLDKAKGDAPEDRPISQYMYGAYGRIIDIEPLDLNRSRPWPMVRMDADWPGRMSGGPVFNAAGNVIGIISSGIDAASSSAMIFGGWRAVHCTFRSLDRARPGWFLCYGALDKNERENPRHTVIQTGSPSSPIEGDRRSASGMSSRSAA
jgi:hypothetical protein